MSGVKKRMKKVKARWDYMEEAIRKRIASEVCIAALIGWWKGNDVDDFDDYDKIVEDSGSDDEESEELKQKQPKVCTSTIKVLALTAFLFAFITVLQAFAAVISNSQALLIDCVSMGVDSLTYCMNIGVECVKGTRIHRIAELIVGFLSLSVLIFFTLQVTIETLPTIIHPHQQCEGFDSNSTIADPFDCENANPDDEVNGWIVMAFAIGGITFDLICLHAFYRNHQKTQAGKSMNIWTALMHVGADLLRSTATFVSSMLMLVFKANSQVIDAWTTMFISLTIMFGALSGLVAWARKFCSCLCSPKCGFDYDDDEDEDEGADLPWQ